MFHHYLWIRNLYITSFKVIIHDIFWMMNGLPYSFGLATPLKYLAKIYDVGETSHSFYWPVTTTILIPLLIRYINDAYSDHSTMHWNNLSSKCSFHNYLSWNALCIYILKCKFRPIFKMGNVTSKFSATWPTKQ